MISDEFKCLSIANDSLTIKDLSTGTYLLRVKPLKKNIFIRVLNNSKRVPDNAESILSGNTLHYFPDSRTNLQRNTLKVEKIELKDKKLYINFNPE